ncbi:helix-turn-helix transcriptional regulator [Methylobacterium sp. WL30]|uniref:helix-turn-helix domain-containing protein n=1 Tax=unclassified Methylobacterium TaxID=2615210 RepID=UPI0011C6EA9C|nr:MULTISPECIES: helix-turn-helix domain-containing protein [unclassified Methylobacterium]TXN40656.1 helix-turn-helix transcriptional regulator [Methylobacterium sp. WL93]TXN49980.1 helix-turn-helix transcriptional regulator [Methylobacterium sp. WL119]TXN60790.1 helix-turn-helix transcriptional regulator [Methylobacterium sp. WL30]
MKTLDQILETLPEERRDQIAGRSDELILEEYALRRMRKARKLTQERMAELLGVRQDSISRLERRSDLLLSTLRSYVEAMGGSLQLTVKFDDEQPVTLPSLQDVEERSPISHCDYVHSCWALPTLIDWSHADITATANSNAERHAFLKALQVTACRPQTVIDPHAVFGTVLLYRYDPPRQCHKHAWSAAEVPCEPADHCR